MHLQYTTKFYKLVSNLVIFDVHIALEYPTDIIVECRSTMMQ